MIEVSAQEFRDMSESELKEKGESLKQELFNLRFQKATGQLGNSAMIGKAKKDLARVKTLLRESEISGEVERG